MNGEARRKRIDILSRKNRGDRLKPAVFRRFSSLLGVEAQSIRLIDLESTDKLYDYIRKARPFSKEALELSERSRYLYSSEVGEVQRLIADIRGSFEDVPIVLLHEVSEVTGGIKLTLHSILDKAFDLFRLDGEDLVAISPDLSTGLMIEYFSDNTGVGLPRGYRASAWQCRPR